MDARPVVAPLLVDGRLLTPGEDEEQLRRLAGLPSVPREPLEVRREAAASEPTVTGAAEVA